MTQKEDILKIVFKAIDEVNQQLPRAEHIQKSPESALSQLDSLNIVNLIVALEQNIEESLGVSIILGDHDAFYAGEGSAIETVATLVECIFGLVEDQNA